MTEPQLPRDPLSSREFDSYFALLSRLLRLSRSQAEDVASELRDHLSLRFAELVERGVDHDDAIQQALEEFGDAAALAADFVSIRQQSRRRWMMRVGIGSVSVCLVALVATSLFWPVGGGEIAPATAVAQQNPRKSPVVKNPVKTAPAKVASKLKSDEQMRNEATEKKLEKSMTADFIETPLHDVVAFMSGMVGVQFYIDKNALNVAGIEKDTPITFQLKDVPTSFILQLVLKEVDLGYYVRHGVVIITTPERLEVELETRVYDVRDLTGVYVEKPAPTGIGGDGWGGTLEKATVKANNKRGFIVDAANAKVIDFYSPSPVRFHRGLGCYSRPGGYEYDLLIDLIRSTVAPETWRQDGGPASIGPFRGLLVVSHTSHGHRELSRLLEDIRNGLGEKK